MSDVRPYLWLIPGLPLLGAVIIAFLGPRFLKKQSHWPCILGVAGAFVVSLLVFLNVKAGGEHFEAVREYYPWIQVANVDSKAPNLDIGLTLRADALSAMMATMVTFIATFIAIYAVGYMDHSGGYPRFFAEVSLFVAAMTTLVLGDNFLVLLIGWEGVGLCSYLLIGFWFEKPEAAAAARKAFLVTRIGDVGLMLGILLIWTKCGSLDYDTVFKAAGALDASLISMICLLLFCGAAGKSAQFPLHVWLPDAMEGPTPVSALIHAATMVTAGVYLVARCTPLFVLAPGAQMTVACIGGFTALFAALIALTQNDLKRVLAYSTLSQLGYMFLALGCGVGENLVTFAVVAAMFHLFTHAFFKALLFLAAGSVMHGMGDVIDMRKFSGLHRVMPKTHATFLVGALALSGFPLLSGFWSKDEILDAAFKASRTGGAAGSIYLLLLVVGIVTAGLTAFYTFRAYFKTFRGELRVPPQADQPHGHAASHGGSHGGSHGSHGAAPAPAPAARTGPRASYENPLVMTFPLMVLAVFAAGVGYVVGPFTFLPESFQFGHFLADTPGFPHEGDHAPNFLLMAISTAAALGGIAVAWLMYVKKPELPGDWAASAQSLYQLSLNKFHVDELYDAFFVKPITGLAVFLRLIDQFVVDGLVDLIGYLPSLVGHLFRPVQNGLVQFYALAMVLGLGIFLIVLLLPLLRAM